MSTFNTVLIVAVLWFLTQSILCESVSEFHARPLRILEPGNPFRYNLAQNVSSDDPILKSYLWAGQNVEPPTRTTKRGPKILEYKLNKPKDKTLAARADYGPAPYGPLIDFPSCLSCQGKAKRTNTMSVATDFMAEQMIPKMKLFAFLGNCLFYAQRPPGTAGERSLSQPASAFACSSPQSFSTFKARTIWHLWPNKGCNTEENYYCLNPRAPECCWLNPLMPGATQEERIPQSMLYFQQMSRAMALTCEREVYILIDNPDDVLVQQPDPYPSIWLTHEFPALQGLYAEHIVTKLYAIRVSDKQVFDKTALLQKNNPRAIDWNEPVARAIKAKKLELLKSGYYSGNMSAEHVEELNELEKRDGPCGSAADQEAPGLDYFG